ncbi:MAG: hypothetical protein ACKO0M_08080 [Cyanobium sp.]
MPSIPGAPAPAAPTPIAGLLAALEALSRSRADRVLRLRGHLPEETGEGPGEPFELLIFRGFSSLTTHPTDVDPDRPALPEGCSILSAELLLGPLNPAIDAALTTPQPAEHFLDPAAWR